MVYHILLTPWTCHFIHPSRSTTYRWTSVYRTSIPQIHYWRNVGVPKTDFLFVLLYISESLNIGYIPVSCDSSAFNYCSKDWLKYQVHWTESTGSSSTSIETTSFKKSYTTQYLESVWSPIRTYINIFSFMCNNIGLSNYEYSQVTVNAHGPLVTKTSESLMIQHEM